MDFLLNIDNYTSDELMKIVLTILLLLLLIIIFGSKKKKKIEKDLTLEYRKESDFKQGVSTNIKKRNILDDVPESVRFGIPSNPVMKWGESKPIKNENKSRTLGKLNKDKVLFAINENMVDTQSFRAIAREQVKEDFKYEVEMVHNYDDMKSSIDNSPPSIIVIDINLENTDVIDVIIGFKNNIKTMNIPVILLADSTEVIPDFMKVIKVKKVLPRWGADILNEIDEILNPSNKMKVLLVDDALVIREYIKRLLSDKNYNVITAENGAIAYEILNTEKVMPDLIITDLEMPIMRGEELINKIRESSSFDNVPIIVISAYENDSSKLIDSFKIQGFNSKPFRDEDLISQIEYVLNHY